MDRLDEVFQQFIRERTYQEVNRTILRSRPLVA